MKSARKIGNYAQHRSQEMGISPAEINNILNFSDSETNAFFKGRRMLTYGRLMALSKLLNTTVKDMLEGDEVLYSESVVHCMNEFDDDANREEILDIIDDYMDIRDALLRMDE